MTTFMWTTGGVSTVIPMLPAMRDAHIDVVMSYSVTTETAEASVRAYLDALYANGMGAMLNIIPLTRDVMIPKTVKEFSEAEIANIQAYCARYYGHPALWGFYVDDEATAERYPVAPREQAYAAIKAVAQNAQVLEAHYHLESGAYSPNAHDWFACHAGAADSEMYAYKYTTFSPPPDYGCIDLETGAVSRSTEATMLANYQSNLTSIRTALDAAGEENYTVLFGAFRQTEHGQVKEFAFPPAAAGGYDGGITRMWTAAQNAGFAQHAGWFLWYAAPYVSGTPTEHLEGIGNVGYESQRAELTAIAQSVGGGLGWGDFDLRLSGSTGDFDLRLQSLVSNRRRQHIALGGV